MSDFDSAALQSAVTDDSTDLEPRDARALTEYIGVIPEGGDIYTVVGENQNGEYRVDAREGRCTCKDAQYNLDDDEQCKHERRIAFETGQRAIPGWLNRDKVNDVLGDHTDDEVRYAASDGGSSTVNPQGQVGEDGQDRPEDCTCSPTFEELPCWSCHRAGFETPANSE